MANIIKRVWNQNRMVQIEDLKGMTFQAEQAGHTFEISGIDDAGNTVALTGTPAGVFLRPDNTDVAMTCSVSGGKVSATLPANCYDVPGRFAITIFITSGGSKTAIYAAIGTVSRTSSGTAAPGTTQSVVDLINAINAAINSIPASYSSLLADIAPDYSNSALYSVGQYAWYDGDLKRCIVPITTAESYKAAHWTSAVLGQDVSDLKSAMAQEVSALYNSFSDFGDKYDLDQIVEGDGYLVSSYKYIVGLIPGNSIIKPVKIVTRNNVSATYVTLEIWKRTEGTNNFTKNSTITGKNTGMVGSLYILEFDYFYTADEILLVISDTTSGGYISRTIAEGYSIKRFNRSTTTLDLHDVGTASDVKVSYAWGYINLNITDTVDEMGNALEVFATRFDKINQSSVSGLAPTKRWICRFVKAGTYVRSFDLQVAAKSMEYLSAELWETSDGTTYTRKNQLVPVSVEAMPNQYKLTFPSFTTEKDGFICTYDTSTAGQARYTSLTGNDVLYFDKTAESITVSGMSILGNASVCYKIEAYEPNDNSSDNTNKIVTVKPDGTGTYTTVIEAMTTEPEGTPIYVYPGIYDQDMTACLKKRVILIGTDRNQCIIRDTDGRYNHHPLFVSCGYFENLTITSKYISGTSHEIGTDTGSYAVHIDGDDDYGVGKQLEFYHCNISSDFFPAIGCGLRKDLTLIIDDCILENNQIAGRGAYFGSGTLGALYFHDANGVQGNQYAIIKNNVMKTKGTYALCIYQVDREPQNNRVYCDFINNVLYSETGHYADTVWFRNDPLNENTGIFSIEIGYGNSISSLNNNT